MVEQAFKGELRGLTSLRFVAAFYVFLFHVQIRAPLAGDGPVADFLKEGAVGMTLFFMLSGFILAYVYGRDRIDIEDYAVNRFARIYPVYLVAAALALPWLINQTYDSGSFLVSSLQFLVLFVSGILMLQAWLPHSFTYWNNPASWSLSCEAFFYALFPAFWHIFGKTSARAALIMLAVCAIGGSVVPAAYYVFDKAAGNFALIYTLPVYRVLEFVAGILAFRLMTLLPQSFRAGRWAIVAVLAMTLLLAFAGPIVPTYTLFNVALVPTVGLVLVALARMPRRSGFWQGSIMVYLGRISYCFYMFQFHVLEGARHFVNVERVGAFAYFLITFLLLLAVSAVTYHLVEEPFRRRIRMRKITGVPTP